MAIEPPAWASDWSVDLRVWVEREGKAILGKGRLELLEAIDQWHSISAAARQIGMSYRRAWVLVQSINEAAGQPMVVAATGGTRGGGARLTDQGRRAARVFRELLAQIHLSAAAQLSRLVQGSQSAAVHVAASVSLAEVLGQLLADYALRRPEVALRTVFGASDEPADHLIAAAPADLFLTADLQQLERLGAGETAVPLAENSLAAVAPADSAIRVASRPISASRRFTASLWRSRAVRWAAIRGATWMRSGSMRNCGSALTVDNSCAVLAAVRAGQADVGLVYSSDAVRAEGCRLLFQAERDAVCVRDVAAVLGRFRQPEVAAELLGFLTSKHGGGRFRQCGFLAVRSD